MHNVVFTSSHNSIRTVPHRDVQNESLKKYGLIVTCLLSFVFRCFKGWESSYRMSLTLAQEQACKALENALFGGQPAQTRADVHLPVDYDFSAALDDDEPDDLDDEEYEDLEENEQESIEGHPDLLENPVQRCILDLLVSLFTHLPVGTDGKFYNPIFRFLVLFSIKKNGQWISGRRITQLFAALLFCGREVIMTLMHREVMESSTSLRYSE